MIHAKIERDTKFITIDGHNYCAYCGKEIKPDTEIDHYETYNYYHCDCPDALKQIKIEDEIKTLNIKHKKDLSVLEAQLPKLKFERITKTTLKKI